MKEVYFSMADLDTAIKDFNHLRSAKRHHINLSEKETNELLTKINSIEKQLVVQKITPQKVKEQGTFTAEFTTKQGSSFNSKLPMDAFDILLQLNKKNIHSELVKQDVLFLHGRNDHFVPFKMYGMQMKALKNARSLTGRVFTKQEHAQNQCQIGNIELALDTIIKWIEEKQ